MWNASAPSVTRGQRSPSSPSFSLCHLLCMILRVWFDLAARSPTQHYSRFSWKSFTSSDWLGQICSCWLEEACVLIAISSAQKNVHGAPAVTSIWWVFTSKATVRLQVNVSGKVEARKKALRAFSAAIIIIDSSTAESSPLLSKTLNFQGKIVLNFLLAKA